MSIRKSLRSATTSFLGDTEYKEIDSFYQLPVRQAPTGVAIIGRLRFLTSKSRSGQNSIQDAYNVVVSELIDIWAKGLNIYPASRRTVKSKLSEIYEGKSAVGGKQRNTKKSVYGFRDLFYTVESRRNDSWHQKVSEFNEKMKTGIDIRTFDSERIKELTLIYDVKMKDEDEELYIDNCKMKTCSCSWSAITKCPECPRRMYSSDKVDTQWKKWLERKLRDSNKREKADDIAMEPEGGLIDDANQDDTPCDSEEADPSYDGKRRGQDLMNSAQVLRSHTDEIDPEDKPLFPQVPIRFNRKELNPKVMAAIVHIQSRYKVSDNDVEGLCVDLANMVFDQQWIKESERNSNEDENISGSESEESEANLAPRTKIRKKASRDLTYTFPCRSTRRRWLRQGALLNLRYVAHQIMKKDTADIVTLGFDDTTKAAGVRIYDVKTTNISIKGDTGGRKTFTTGFTPNLSHSGADQAKTLTFNLQSLAILAGDNTSVDEIKSQIDFWMSDRVADTDVTLAELEVDKEKILKCSAHPILAIDEAINKVMLEVETNIGREKLIGQNCGSFAFQSKSSIVILGLMAISKCLSPSHAVASISLYKSYKDWRQEEGLDYEDFKGFQTNRFGRTSFLASLYLKHQQDLTRYFDEEVDENSNRLVLALTAYFQSDWFTMGCRVYSTFESIIIKPLCVLLGIDANKSVNREDRNWIGVKVFFETKLTELKAFGLKKETTFDKLISKCALGIVEALERQLSKKSFFRNESSPETVLKMLKAPLTNSGCESRLAQLDVRVDFCGGSAPINTISDKQVVSVNNYFSTDEFKSENKKELFQWARNSEEAKEVNKLQDEFLENVKMVNTLARKVRKEKKNKKILRAVKLATICQEHGGPVTINNIEILDKLDEKQLVDEVFYLKATVASEIKAKKREKDEVTGKMKVNVLPMDVLRKSILSVLQPNSSDQNDDINELLNSVLT